jgi:thiamine biosynthesis protein ThiS
MSPDTIVIVANGEEKRVNRSCTVAWFLSQCGWKPTQVVVERNGNVLPRNELENFALEDGDRLEVIVPVAGG